MTDTVLVVGAGPVGLTAACQLARLGVRVRVVEALERPTTESRAVGVHPRSMEMLAALGVLPQLEARGRCMPGLAMLDGRTGATRLRIDATHVPSRHAYVLDVPQPDTEAVLADRAAELGVVVERGVRLTGLAQDADGVSVTLRSSTGDETTRVGWVVGADGGHSTTRALAGTKLEGGFHGQHFAMADVDVDTTFPPDAIRMFQHPDGMAMLFPMAGERARVMFFVEPPAADAGDPTLEQIQALADDRMAGRVKVRNPRWLTYFEVHHAQVPRYRLGRVLLAGDAAHIHSPAGAQGMNTGIQDAANLAWKLALVAQGRAGAELLDTYDDERHPIGAAVVRTTTMMTNVGTATGPEAVVRNLGLFLVGHLPRLADAGAAAMTETTINYRGSALAVRVGGHRHGAASGRARARPGRPGPPGRHPGDRRGAADSPGMLLLVRSGDDDAVDELRRALGELGTVVRVGRDVVDPGDVIGRHYGLGSEGLALIRPDGYLGLVADSADAAVLRAYLADTLRVTQPATV